MKPIRPAVVALALLLGACGGGGAGTGSAAGRPEFPAPAAFGPDVNAAYLPLTPGTTAILEGVVDGRRRHEEVRTLEVRRMISGISCTGLEERVFDDGVLSELTTEWFAEDRGGDVWKLGEESFDFSGLSLAPTADSWIAGEHGAWPFLAFPADPIVGARWIGFRPDGVDTFVATSRSAVVSTFAGTFAGCLEVTENPDDPEDADIILYDPGAGRVRDSSPGGTVELVAIRVR